jgi:ATP-dependent exoDNAse (exonuclease V) alpha subunit
MASYHFSAQVLRRSQGRSAIQAAAYRAGERLRDLKNNKTYDYRRKRGVSHTEILLPEGACEALRDREHLWNVVEHMEIRRDAQLAREINIALPHELTADQRRTLLLEFVREQFVRRGMVADVCFHDPVPEKGDSPQNFHCHVLLSLRQTSGKAFRGTKTREWNSESLLNEWRQIWEVHQNHALEQAGHSARVDHRTLAAQRHDAETRRDRAAAFALDREAEIHVGPRADKASRQERPPRSRDRPAGPFRKHDKPQPQRRTVNYTKLDRGTRLEANLAIIDRNLDRLSRQLARWQGLAARFRLRRSWLSKQEYSETLAAERATRDRAWQKRRDQAAVIKAMTGGGKWHHRRKRRGLADRIISDLEVTLASLLGVRDRHFKRRARHHDRVQHRGPHRPRTRTRSPW